MWFSVTCNSMSPRDRMCLFEDECYFSLQWTLSTLQRHLTDTFDLIRINSFAFSKLYSHLALPPRNPVLIYTWRTHVSGKSLSSLWYQFFSGSLVSESLMSPQLHNHTASTVLSWGPVIMESIRMTKRTIETLKFVYSECIKVVVIKWELYHPLNYFEN